MRKTLTGLLLFLSFLLTGCIEFNLKVELNPDGSGTITEEVLFSTKMAEMIESLSQMGGEAENAEEFNPLDMEELKSRETEYGEGVTLVKAEEIERKSMKGYSAVYRFKNINKLKLNDDPASRMPDDMPSQGGETEEAPFTFSFTKGNTSELVIKLNKDMQEEMMKEDIEEEQEDEENDAMFQQMKELLKDMKTTIVLKIDGDIVETNATHVDDNKITLVEFQFGKLLDMPEKFEQLKKFKPKSFDEMKEFISDVPGFKIEFNDEVKVRFK